MSAQFSRWIFVLAILAVSSLLTASDERPVSVTATLKGHTEALYAVAFSPDGKLIATGSFDKTVKLWDLDGKEIRTLGGPAGHQNLVLAVGFSRNGQWLASGSSDNSAKIWDVPSSSPLREFAFAAPVQTVAMSPDGTKVAGSGADGAIKVWNAADGKPAQTIAGHSGAVNGLAYSANNQLLASAGADSTLRFWNAADGKPISTAVAHSGAVNAVAFHPNNTQAFSIGEDGTLKFWQLPIAPSRTLGLHADAVTHVVESANGAQVLSASADKTIRLFDFGNGQLVRQFAGAIGAVNAVALTPNGNLVAGGTADGRMFLWNAADAKVLGQKLAHNGGVTSLIFHPQSTQLLSAGKDGTIKLWPLPPIPSRSLTHPVAVLAATTTTDGKRLFTGGEDKILRSWDLSKDQVDKQFTGHTAPITAMVVSANGQILASASADKTIRFWDLGSGKEKIVLAAHTAPVTSLSLHANGQQLLSASEDGTVKIWQLPVMPPANQPAGVVTIPPLRQIAHGAPVLQALFSPKGDQVFSWGDDKALKLWNAADGKPIKSVPVKGPIAGVATSADSAKVFVAEVDGTVSVWANPPGDKPVASFPLPAPIQAIAVSLDGARLAVASDNKGNPVIRVVDLTNGMELVGFTDHTGPVRSLQFAADNRTLLSASADKTVRYFDAGVIAAWNAHPGGVVGVAFNNNGSQALSAGADKTVKIWDLVAGKPIRTIGPLADSVSAVAYSRDFTQIGAATGNAVKVWNAADGKELLTLPHPAAVTSLSFSPDKTKLVTGSADNLTRVWDLATGKDLQAFRHAGPVTSVVFHSDNKTVLSGSVDKTVVVDTISAIRVVSASAAPLRALAVTPSGSHVLTGGDDKSVAIWNAANGARERTLPGAEGAVLALAVSRNGALVAAGGADQTVRVYQFADGKLLGQLKAPGPVRSLAFSPNNQVLTAACADKSVLAWIVVYNPGQPLGPDFGKPVATLAHSGPATGVTFAPDGSHFFSSSQDQTIKDWKLASEVPIKNFGHPNLVDAVAFNSTGTLLATGCHDGNLRIWDVAKGQPVQTVPAHIAMNQPAPIYSISWSPDDKQVLTASYDRSMKLWNAADGKLVREFKGFKEKEFEKGHHDGVFSAAFSSDGKFIASGSSDRTVKLWNVADGTVVREFVNPNVSPPASALPGPAPAHPGWVYSVRFTPDGKHLVSAGNAPRGHGYLAVWSVADGKLLYGEELSLGPIYSVDVSGDGKSLVLGCGPRGRDLQETNGYILKMPEAVK
jgi:WD40 repeat protein